MSGNITFIIYPQSGVSADAHYLDVSEETTIAVTYTIQDLTDITKRKGAYSKTIVLPGTENNNRAFKNAFNVQAFTGGWTPNKQITCRIFSDGVQIFSGTLQLMSISILNDKPKYECAIYGGEIGLFKNMDDRLLCETVGVSDYDHTWERSMFPDVFTAGYYAGIVYTLIDNVGLWHCKELDSNGNGGAFSGLFAWLQAVMDRIIPLEFFKPAVFVKDLVGLIFAEHGYTYTSNFFNSDPVYDRLIIPYAGDGLIFTDEANKTFVGTNEYVEFDGESPFDTWVATFDLTGNAGTYPYEMAGCGQYTSYTYYACSNYSGNYYIEIYFPSLGGLFNNWELTISVYDIDALTNIFDVDGVECTWTYGGNAASVEVRVSAIVNLKADQRIQIIVQRPNGSTGGEFIDASVSDAYVLIDLIKRLSFEGAYVEVSKGLPPTIKQIDLLADLQKMFNLYFYADPENPNNIIIEPFNEFYSASPVDWSLKIDRSREINITCGDPENRKRFIFSYAQTDEAQAAEYRRDEGEQYGCRTWDTENFYGKGDEAITTKCGTLIPAQYRTNIVAARVWGLQGNGTIREGKIGYRIAQYNYIDFVIGGNYEWWLYPDADNTIDLNSANIQTKFPYAGHVDNPFNPTEDIAFGMPKRLYWKLFDPSAATYIQYTNNNLFNKYWLNYIVEITSAEAMTLTAYFEITIRDINGLNFRRPIYYNGILWRLLEIADYEIGKNVVIKCTLRRILNLGAFVPDLIDPFQNTGTALTTENEYTPVFSHPVIGL